MEAETSMGSSKKGTQVQEPPILPIVMFLQLLRTHHLCKSKEQTGTGSVKENDIDLGIGIAMRIRVP